MARFQRQTPADERAPLRSVSAAIRKLRELDPQLEGNVEIKTQKMLLPDRQLTGLVVVLAPVRLGAARRWIPMASSAKFRATSTLGVRQEYDIEVLNDAVGDEEGNVQLSNSEYVYNIDLMPSRLPYDLTIDQRMIVRHVIRFLQAEEKCYRPIHREVGVIVLDYAKLPTIRIPSIKAVQYELGKTLPDVNPHLIATTVARAGFQMPRAAE